MLHGMAAERPAEADTVAYHGEVWTDGRGFATVRLPAGADVLEAPVEYELRDIDPSSSARVTAKLERGRFTIATEQPHVKVAWRITARRSKSSDGSRPSQQRRV
jgi:hypothetical protein